MLSLRGLFRVTRAALPMRTTASSASALPSSSSLSDFFDDQATWGLSELRPKHRPGRAWTAEELRLKSNSDLHKLWFVCLRERNMLLTMQKVHIRHARHFPNPERLDRVDETMEAIKEVIDERDDAVLRLETGEGASPPTRRVTSFMGFTYNKRAEEHLVEMEGEKMYEVPMLDEDARMMQMLWKEKEFMKGLERVDDERRAAVQNKRMIRFKRGGPRVMNRGSDQDFL